MIREIVYASYLLGIYSRSEKTSTYGVVKVIGMCSSHVFFEKYD